jgi:hypothetical protein
MGEFVSGVWVKCELADVVLQMAIRAGGGQTRLRGRDNEGLGDLPVDFGGLEGEGFGSVEGWKGDCVAFGRSPVAGERKKVARHWQPPPQKLAS